MNKFLNMIGSALGWFFGVGFVILSLGMIFIDGSYFLGLIALFASCLLIPPIRNFIIKSFNNKFNKSLNGKGLVIGGVIAFFSTFINGLPSESEMQAKNQEPKVQAVMSQPTKAEEIKPKKAEEVKPKKTEEVKPKKAEEVKPKKAEEVKPKKVEEVKPKKVEEVKPKKVEEVKPKKAEEVKPKKAEEVKPKKAEEVKPKKVEEVKPKKAETVKPKKAEMVKPKGKCGHKRYCKDMSNCKEAMFYLNQCGLSKLDRDNDGIPCEALCG